MVFNTKFSLPSFLKQADRLTDSQRSSINKAGFGNLLHIPDHMLCRVQLVELMETWSCEKQAFVFPFGEMTITLLDVALILGLRVVGEPVVLWGDAPITDLEMELGASSTKRSITVESLKERLESLGERDDGYFVTVFLLYCFGTLLFPSVTGKVDSRYVSVLQDVDSVSRLAWGAAVLADICDSLNQRISKKSTSVGGCLILLQIWCYEHVLIRRPRLLHGSSFPRICRWKCIDRQYLASRELAIKFSELEPSQILWKLKPTSEETRIDIVRDILAQELDCCSNVVSTDKEHHTRTRPALLHEGGGKSTILISSDDDENDNDECVLITKRQTLKEENLKTENEPPIGLKDENLELKAIIEDLTTENKKLDKENLDLKVLVEDLRKENEIIQRIKEENVELRNLLETKRREKQNMDICFSNLEKITNEYFDLSLG